MRQTFKLRYGWTHVTVNSMLKFVKRIPSYVRFLYLNNYIITYSFVQIHLKHSPPSQRAPPEIWHRIACHIPRYHLRTWLSVSAFHRSIALPLIFHTIDLYFGEDSESSNRGLDILERVKSDPGFARRVKVLRLHWSYEEGDMLDLMASK